MVGALYQALTGRNIDGRVGLINTHAEKRIDMPTPQGMHPVHFRRKDDCNLMSTTCAKAPSCKVRRQDGELKLVGLGAGVSGSKE